MEIELIILCVVLVLSVVAHYFFWRDGKRRYDENMRQIDALNRKLMQLEANEEEAMKEILNSSSPDFKRNEGYLLTLYNERGYYRGMEWVPEDKIWERIDFQPM